MKCRRHQTTELRDGVCPECGWTDKPTSTVTKVIKEVPIKKVGIKKAKRG